MNADTGSQKPRQRAFSVAILLDVKYHDREHGDFPRGLMAQLLMDKLDMTRATAFRYVADYIVARGIARRLRGEG